MIISMRHLDLVTLVSDREATLVALRKLGAVHLDLASAAGHGVSAVSGQLADAEKAVRLILKARGRRTDYGLRPRAVEEVLALDADRETLAAEKERLEREIAVYAPYGDFDPILARKILDRGIDLSADLPAKLPEVRLSKIQEKLARVLNRLHIDEDRIASSDEREILRRFPRLREAMAFAQARELLEDRGAIAVVSGWIPAPRVDELTAAARACGWALLLREPAVGEVPPTLIEPPKIFRPVTALFGGLGISPAYEEADVSVPFFCYFSLFFAMLVGDGGYGAVILALTLFGWRKTSLGRSPLVRSWLTLLTVFSVATIAWGALSNTWFGAGIPGCSAWPTVRWLSGADALDGHAYDNMMLLCFTIGASHLMLARVWSGLSMLNSVRCLAQFGWAGIILFMYVVTNVIVGIFPAIPTWCYWMFGLSFLTVFVQAKGFDKGMLFLNTMSVLGDVISYVRLFAVGLASVKVASNFNGMALGIYGLSGEVWLKPLLALGMVAVLLFGHVINFVMAGLSILVHAVRLNTLEFSNHKGITWAGYAFRPFQTAKE